MEYRFVPIVSVSNARVTTTIKRVQLMHQGKVVYVASPGQHGWTRCNVPLYKTEEGARIAACEQLRQIAAQCHDASYRLVVENSR